MLYNIPEYKYKLNSIEIKTLNLMRKYERMRRKYSNDYSYNLFSKNKDPRKSSFFESFKNLIIKSKEKNTKIPCPELFIKSQFEMIKSERRIGNIYCPPQYLFSKYSWNRYKKYVDELCFSKNIKINNNKKTKSNKINIIRDFNNTHEFINNYYLNNYGELDVNYTKLFNDDKIWFFVLNKYISHYFLSISKTFSKSNVPIEIIKEIQKNICIYKQEIFSDEEILNIAKKLFKDEIDGKYN